MKPVRVQRKRTRGWKMPPNTVSVCRPGPWGNPARVGDYFIIGDPFSKGPFRMTWVKTTAECADSRYTFVANNEIAVSLFRQLAPKIFTSARLEVLRGKNLACYCALDKPCHADVLLELANA